MADPRYAIDWTPPDIGPGASLIASVLNQNRTQARADEYLGMQREGMRRSAERESHEMKRQADNEAHRRAVEAYNALPTLMRAAHRSPEMANANPFGVRFEQEQAPPPSIADVDIMGAKDGSFGEHARQSLASHFEQTQDEIPQPSMPYRGADTRSPMGQHNSGAGPITPEDELEHVEFGADDEPSEGITAAHALLGTPRKSKLFASMGGNRFEVPEQSETSGFGPKYDAIYQRALQEPGVTPEEAFNFVAKMAHDDTAEAGKNQRLKDAIGGRDRSREDHEEFLRQMAAKYKLTAEEQARLRREGFDAQKAAAGAAAVSPFVPELIRMTEEGAPASEVYSVAAEKKVPQKQFATATQNVVKNAATAERAGEKRASLAATGEGTKEGDMWKSPQAATKGTQQIQRFHRVRERLDALIKDVETHGERIDFDSKQYVRRQSLAEAVAAALRPYNELSSTDASMKAERAILGPTGAFGHGWTLGADLQTLRHILHEAEGQQKVNLETLIRPGGGAGLAPSLGGQRKSGGVPAGAIMGKLNGRRGYVINGKFTPVE